MKVWVVAMRWVKCFGETKEARPEGAHQFVDMVDEQAHEFEESVWGP